MGNVDYVFEASWEVCNKVGGIWTVIKTKAPEMMAAYENYILIGPYFENNARISFVSMEPPKQFSKAFDQLRSEGIVCRFGKWLDVKGKPFTILIDFQGIIRKKDEIKTSYWLDYGIDSLRAGWDFEEPLLWSYCVGKMIGLLAEDCLQGKNVVAHFHEWLSGAGLLYLKNHHRKIATVFTTHATVLGRTLSSMGVDIYNAFQYIDILRQVYNHMIESKFLMEKAAAENADIFTTVSEITSIESERFLGRKADIFLLNGLDIDRFPDFDYMTVKHLASREKLKEFLIYHFFPYYQFDIDSSLILFTSGRFEFRNKGYDLLIRALGIMNEQMKNTSALQKSDCKNIIVIFWVPMQHYGLKLEVLESKNYYMQIKVDIAENNALMLNRMISDFISKKDSIGNIFSENFVTEIKKDILAFERQGLPPLSTHKVDDSNELITALRNNGLMNRKEDVVKVVVAPVYLDGGDGIIDMQYFDAAIGCDLGVFPSFYEPWGYTPLECASLGVPCLTTMRAGFGRFIRSKNLRSDGNIIGVINGISDGVFVLDNFQRREDEVLSDFIDILRKFSVLDHMKHVDLKMKAKSLSSYADWKVLAKNYFQAHDSALQKSIERSSLK